ncbi:MAG: PAQR family membrane homeostasis protein TrhA, partial [Pyrinomonadaceae bacterium]
MIQARLKELSIEEFANTITHGFGLLLSVVGFVVLLFLAVSHGGAMLIASCAIYGISLITLYTASTVYHGTTSLELKRKLQLVDHCCIYLLIAGSYMPFGLVIIGGRLGQELLIAMWAFATVGIVAKLILRHRYPAVSVISYLIMGWLG